MKRNLFTILSILIAVMLLLPGGAFPTALAGSQASGVTPLNQQGPDEPDQPETKIYIPLSPFRVWAGETYAVSGRIVDGDDQPVAGATVSTDRGQSAVADEDGRYTLQVPPTPDFGDQFLRTPETVFSLMDELTGLTELSVAKEGFACTPLTIRLNVPPATDNQNFTCSTDIHNLSGQIVDLQGNPVGGILVTDNAGRSATTGADGFFTIFDVPAGVYTLMPNGGDHLFTPSARTVRVGSSRVRAPETSDLTFIALASPWAPQNLGVAGNLGPAGDFAYTTNRSLAVDSGGNPHIVFGGGLNGLYYGTYDGTLWTITQIDPAANAFYASIALDKHDQPHIAYFVQIEALPDIDVLKYVRATWEGNTLVFGTPQNIDYGRKIAVGTSIAVDDNNRPHIAYYNDEGDLLKYAHSPSGSTWFDEIVDNSGNVGWAPSIAVNASNAPRISYYDFTDQTNGELKYAVRLGDNNWAKTTIAAQVLAPETLAQIRITAPVDITALLAGFGLFSSLAVDSYGYPHIAYFDDYADNLVHAYLTASGWRYEIVDSYQAVGGFASLQLDRRDRPHIGYYDSTNGNLKYALGTGDDWKILIVDNLGDVGALSSIALDTAGNPQFYYYDATAADMKYARRVIWEQQTIGLIGTLLEPGNRNLKLDSDGQPHIAFGGSNLYHGFFDGSVWQFELVDPAPFTGKFASLAIDGNDNIHISYYDDDEQGGNGNLKHAFYNRVADTWTIEVVDSSAPKVGKFTSLTLDSNGRPHIAYMDETYDTLKYAYKSGNTWVREVVDDDGNVGAYPSIALNSSNVPSISYYDFTPDNTGMNLRYAVRLGTNNWHTETVIASGKNGLFTSLAIDSSNRPHIAYFNDDNDDLKYTYKSGGTWYFSTVDTVNSVGWYITMLLDSYDNAHISYYDYSNGNLKYATSKWNRWNVEIIDDAGDVGMFSSITLDKADRPYFLYYDVTNNQLKYARLNMWDVQSIALVSALVEPGRPNLGIGPSGLPHVTYGGMQLNYVVHDGNDWNTYVVDSSNANMGWYASLAVDDKPWAYISYYDALNGDLRFTRVLDEGFTQGYSGLAFDLLDSAGDVGKFTSIALDGSGRPHIAYFDESSDNLKYAFWTGGGWAVEIVDANGNVGPYPYLAIAPGGQPAIAYYDITKRDLKYARRLGGNNWSVTTIHGSGAVGLFASLAFDSYGNPHIAYFDDDFDDLRYAYRAANGYWYYSVIDTRGSTGWFVSLALDSYDNPHISYYDYSNGNLKHAFKYRGAWVIELLDAPGNTGLYTSLQIGNGDSVHILYYDADLNVLRFARAVDWR
jgi:hypothetical protein